jgi:hypothetical protein
LVGRHDLCRDLFASEVFLLFEEDLLHKEQGATIVSRKKYTYYRS